jgi:HD-GYP domain-containing protein (c-di-GMP phosphodiesterase class II)
MHLKSPRSTSQRVRVPFRMKIITPFLALGLALVIGAALVVTRIVFESFSERFTNQLLESGKLAAEWMVIEENRLLSGLRLAAYTQGVSEAIQARDANRLRELTFPLAVNQELEAVEFLDAQGNLLFSMRHVPGGLMEEYQFTSEGDATFSLSPFVGQALSGQPDATGDKFSGLVEVNRSEFFYVAGPVYNEQGQVVGAVMVGTSLENLAANLRQQTLAQITLYHPDGSPLVSSLPSPLPVAEDLVGQILAQTQSGSYQRGLDDARRQIEVLNTGYEELLGPWRAREEVIGLMGVALFRNVFVNPSLPTRLQLIALVVLVFSLTILAGWALASSITRPLARLTRATREVSQGNLDIQVPLPGSDDEIAELTRTFNEMITSLNQAQSEIIGAYDNTLLGCSQALEMREKDTAEHSQRVTEWSVELARTMGMSEEDLVHVRRGALLHDIGKMPIKDSILLKPGPLSEEEFAVMRKHPVYAWDFLSPIEYLRPALEIPYYHHEKWNGTGYPCGLKGEEIPLAARIFSVVDVWDAVTHERVYHKAGTHEEALRIINEGRGSHFDPQVVDVFLQILPRLERMTWSDDGQ